VQRVDWFDHRRPLGPPIGYIPAVEAEGEYYREAALREEEELKQMSLH
jgi:hypothetical protein